MYFKVRLINLLLLFGLFGLALPDKAEDASTIEVLTKMVHDLKSEIDHFKKQNVKVNDQCNCDELRADVERLKDLYYNSSKKIAHLEIGLAKIDQTTVENSDQIVNVESRIDQLESDVKTNKHIITEMNDVIDANTPRIEENVANIETIFGIVSLNTDTIQVFFEWK